MSIALGVAAVIASAGIAAASSSTPAALPPDPLGSIRSIASSCAGSVGPDGFGSATITGVVVLTGAGVIDTPCIVRLADGASLNIANATLRTRKLFLTEQNRTGPRTAVVISNSHFTGIEDAGLQITITHAGSQLTVAGSELNYVLSIGAAVGTGDDAAAGLTVGTSQMTSNDPRSEGILLATTGRGIFANNRFVGPPAVPGATLYAQTCIQANNIGANDRCQAQ